jgi:hypothetical protein
MSTRAHDVVIDLAASQQRVFNALVTPSAIRAWWGAARAIVVPRTGGLWAAAWGEEEDAPEYVTTAVILRVNQEGFPTDPVADDFYTACEGGWRDTLESLRRHLEGEGL